MDLTNFLNKKNIKKYKSLIKQIHEYEHNLYSDLPVNEIANKLLVIKHDKNMKDRNKILHAMALARKASSFILGMSYYDVQLMGAIALFDGCVAEMKTGEGKTLTCSAAVAANFVLGYKTHVATANEYLAQRDQETLEPLYSFLGITSSYCVSSLEKYEKRIAYQADVVYSTAQELGFDFLRDNLVSSKEEKMQPYQLKEIKAIIDEADFILIDEARTPLIISGESPLEKIDIYHDILSFSKTLEKMAKAPEANPLLTQEFIPGDFWIEEKYKAAYLSETGYQKIEKFAIENNLILGDKEEQSIYNSSNSWLIHEVLNSLKGQYCYIKDKDYIVQNDEIIIIDPNTGRLSKGRTWSNGLHQAIETKENVTINSESITLGSISIQNYFRNYLSISGMSGTIMKSTEEFVGIYGTPTIAIPTNKPMIRINHNDQIFLSLKAKYKAIIMDVKHRHSKGQPILIGTTSVAESETISNLLSQAKIKHHVLNAKNNFLEAQIIAQAGQPFSVTVSTSMAGRGTDIILGGNKEALLSILNKQLSDINERKAFFELLISNTEQTEDFQETISENELISAEHEHIDHNDIQEYLIKLRNADYINSLFNEGSQNVRHLIHRLEQSVLKQIEIVETSQENWRKQVVDLGGLYVLGSSRNESRRIDDQLRGRSGRQGDPGESIFYLSVEDPWVNVFGKNPIFNKLTKSVETDEAISAPIVNKAFEKAQEAIESFHYGTRKDTFQYDSVADEGRKHFILLRNSLLENNDMVKQVFEQSLEETYSIISQDDFPNYFDYLELLGKHLSADFDSHLDFSKKVLELPYDKIYYATNKFSDKYKISKKDFDKPTLDYVLSNIKDEIATIREEHFWSELNKIVLRNLDKRWTDHLLFIEEAREHVGFRSLAQKNPLYEFKNICFDSFNSLIKDFKHNVVKEFFDLKKATEQNILISENKTEEMIEA